MVPRKHFSTWLWCGCWLALTSMCLPAVAQTSSRPTNELRRTPRTISRGEPKPAARQASIGFGSARTVSHTYIPRSSRMVQAEPEPLEMSETQEVYESVAEHYEVHPDHGCTSCGGGGCTSCAVESCGSCGGSACAGGCLIPCPQVSFRNMTFFAGVEGFKGPENRGSDGSFGFNGGFNSGFRLPCMPCDWFSGQLGANFVSGNYAGAAFTPSTREQLFVTAGLFRRVDYGLQGGLVIDYRNQNWYSDTELAQLRGNLSWAYPSGDEWGYQFTSPLQDQTVDSLVNGQTITESWEVLDTHQFYYQHVFDECTGTSGRIAGGWTGKSQGLLSVSFWTPLSERWAVNSGFTYIIPENNTNPQGNIDEQWNVGINLVWYPMGLTDYRGRYHRPMFNVADNGTFFVTNP